MEPGLSPVVVECATPDFLQVVPIREETVPNQQSRQTRRSDAQNLFTAPGRRLAISYTVQDSGGISSLPFCSREWQSSDVAFPCQRNAS